MLSSRPENPTMFLYPSISDWMHLGLSSKLWASGNKLHPGPQTLSRMVSGVVWSWLLICPGARAPSRLYSGRHDGAMHGKCSSPYSLFSLRLWGGLSGSCTAQTTLQGTCNEIPLRGTQFQSLSYFKLLWVLRDSIIHTTPGTYLRHTTVSWYIGWEALF